MSVHPGGWEGGANGGWDGDGDGGDGDGGDGDGAGQIEMLP